MPAPKALLSRLAAFDHEHKLTKGASGVLVAFSGGPDSACLLHHLARLKQTRGLRVHALHLDHGLRKESIADARFAVKLANDLGLDIVVEKLPVREAAAKTGRGVEDAARTLRYRAYARWAKELGLSAVATGHQQDDQAETLLLHLLRGSTVRGLAGIPPWRWLREGGPRCRVKVIRPMLALTRAEVRAYLRAYKLPSREDKSNSSEEYTRNWIRLKVLPLLAKKNPQVRTRLAAVAADARKVLKLEGC